jgi:hypothetical protein
VPLYFEGGQLPLVRRLPYRRGFKNPFRVSFAVVNLGQLTSFPERAVVSAETLVAQGLLHPGEGPIKLLADGDVAVALRVRVDRVSAAARAKIEAAGGEVEELLARKEPKQRKARENGKPEAEAAAPAEPAAKGKRAPKAEAAETPAEPSGTTDAKTEES